MTKKIFQKWTIVSSLPWIAINFEISKKKKVLLFSKKWGLSYNFFTIVIYAAALLASTLVISTLVKYLRPNLVESHMTLLSKRSQILD